MRLSVSACVRVLRVFFFFTKSFFDPFRLNGWKAVDLLSDGIKKRKNARKSTEDALGSFVETGLWRIWRLQRL